MMPLLEMMGNQRKFFTAMTGRVAWTIWFILQPFFPVRENRWPMDLFYNMLDDAAIAAFIIWLSFNPQWLAHDQRGHQHSFLRMLGEELTEDQTQVCVQNRKPNNFICVPEIG